VWAAPATLPTGDIPAGVGAAGNPCRVIRPIAETDRPREEAVGESR